MTDPAAAGATALREPDPSLVQYTHWMYALHALSAFIGIAGSWAIVTAFVFGVPSIIAVVSLRSCAKKMSSSTRLRFCFSGVNGAESATRMRFARSGSR